MFHRPRKGPASAQSKSLKDLTRIITPDQFLAEDKRQLLLEKMKKFSGLDPARYDSLCVVLIKNLVNYCQSLPETTNSYYSQAGGLVDHALNRTEAALSLFQDFIVQDKPDLLSEEQKLWQYALYSAAILQGIGKLFVDYRINSYDVNGQLLKQWNPLLDSLSNTGSYYDYEFLKESDIEFRRRLNLLLAKALMPASGFAWIASNSQVLAVWLALLNEDSQGGGTLGAILIRADALAIQRYFTDFLAKAAIGRGGRFGRAGTFSGGVPEGLAEKEQAIGAEFIQWLMNALEEGRIMINKAPLFLVPGGLLMCQEMFQWFAREHPDYKNWQAVQNGFIALGLHQCGLDGNVMSRFEQAHNQQMHSGIVFSDYASVLPSSVSYINLNTGRVESTSATEFIHRAHNNSQFTQQNNMVVVGALQKLSASGQWAYGESESSSLMPGTRHGV